jgi:hypothetical protein
MLKQKRAIDSCSTIASTAAAKPDEVNEDLLFDWIGLRLVQAS